MQREDTHACEKTIAAKAPAYNLYPKIIKQKTCWKKNPTVLLLGKIILHSLIDTVIASSHALHFTSAHRLHKIYEQFLFPRIHFSSFCTQ